MKQRKTPLMGWASWNCFRTNISEEKIIEQAALLVSTGLSKHGYHYVNIDDGFFGGRDEEGHVKPHETRFPHGMKVVAEHIHDLGLSAGIYSDAGDNTCGFYYDNECQNGVGVGLYEHEEKDLRRYLIDWDYDYIKVDWCGGVRLGLSEEEQYTKIGNIIKNIRRETGKSIVYNVCRWQFPGEWVMNVADSWRTGADIWPNFDSVLHQIDMIKPLRKYCGPGHVNDLDMLQIGNGMTLEEDRTHFAMWCMMSTPLMIGCDLSKIKPEVLTILCNDELISINQDKACLQAFVTKSFYDNDQKNLLGEIWVKDLGTTQSKEKAVAFLNRSDSELLMEASLEEMGLGLLDSGCEDGVCQHSPDVAQILVRDLIHHQDLEGRKNFSFLVPGHGCMVLRVKSSESIPLIDHEKPYIAPRITRVTMEEAKTLAKEQGAVLIDVRSEEEYQANHVMDALHIFYADIHGLVEEQIKEKHTPVILYCNTGKRCLQAARTMSFLGYDHLFYLPLDGESKTNI